MRPGVQVSDAMASVCGSAGPECSGRSACRREAVAPECVPAIISRLCSSDTSSAALLTASPRVHDAGHDPVPMSACTRAPRRRQSVASPARPENHPLCANGAAMHVAAASTAEAVAWLLDHLRGHTTPC